MARKTVTTTVEAEQDEELTAEGKAEPLEADVIRALTELDGADDIRWQVHRVSNPNPGYCGELSTAELTMQRIASDNGPGKYKVKGIKPDGKYFKSAVISIATPTKTDTGIDLAALLKESKGGDMMPLLMTMMQQQTQVMVAALQQRREPTASPFPWPALLAVSPALLQAARDAFKNTADDQAIEKLLKQITLVERLRGGSGDKESNWADIIRDALQTLPSMVSRQPVAVTAVQHPSTQPVHAAPPTLPAAGHVETPEAVEATPQMLGEQWLRKKLDELIGNAAESKDPDLRAHVFLDDLPVYIPQSMVVGLLNADNWFEQLAQFDARVHPYSGWFGKFREELLAIIAGDNDDEEDERR